MPIPPAHSSLPIVRPPRAAYKQRGGGLLGADARQAALAGLGARLMRQGQAAPVRAVLRSAGIAPAGAGVAATEGRIAPSGSESRQEQLARLPDALDCWGHEFHKCVAMASRGLARAALSGVGFPSEFRQLVYGDEVVATTVRDLANRLPSMHVGYDERRCPDEFLVPIQEGLYTCAEALSLAETDQLGHEARRTRLRLVAAGDRAKGRYWHFFSGDSKGVDAVVAKTDSLETISDPYRVPGRVLVLSSSDWPGVAPDAYAVSHVVL